MDFIRLISIILTIIIAITCTLLIKSERIRHFAEQLGTYHKVAYTYKLTDSPSNLNTTIRFSSGKLVLYPIDAQNNLINFAAKYKLNQTKPEVLFLKNQDSANLEIKQKRVRLLSYGLLTKTRWNLGLNTLVTHNIDIETDHVKSTINLSKLKIKNFNLQIINGLSTIDFSEANPIIMDVMTLAINESATCSLKGLLNSKAKKINISSRDGKIFLNFSGSLAIPTEVQISGNVKKLKIIIPKTINANIYMPNINNLNTRISGFSKHNGFYFYSMVEKQTSRSLKINLLVTKGKIIISTF